jgi:hypothetical protein
MAAFSESKRDRRMTFRLMGIFVRNSIRDWIR